jgi:hypothetical protein
MGAIQFGSVTEMRYGEVRYGSDVVALFLPGLSFRHEACATSLEHSYAIIFSL